MASSGGRGHPCSDVPWSQVAERAKITLFVVARIECDYRRPARLDDLIQLDVRVVQAGRASVVFEQVARRGDEVLAVARIRAGCVDTRTLAPKAMPAPMLAAMKNMAFSEPTR